MERRKFTREFKLEAVRLDARHLAQGDEYIAPRIR